MIIQSQTNMGGAGSALVKDVFLILDSCIQSIEHQSSSQLISNIPHQATKESCNLIENLEKMLDQVSELNKDLKLLQILKYWLCSENALSILNLLSSKTYRNYNETKLEALVKPFFRSQIA